MPQVQGAMQAGEGVHVGGGHGVLTKADGWPGHFSRREGLMRTKGGTDAVFPSVAVHSKNESPQITPRYVARSSVSGHFFDLCLKREGKKRRL